MAAASETSARLVRSHLQTAINGNQLNLEGDGGCQIKIVFGKGSLEVTEYNGQCGGLGVSFIGTYKRAGAPKCQ